MTFALGLCVGSIFAVLAWFLGRGYETGRAFGMSLGYEQGWRDGRDGKRNPPQYPWEREPRAEKGGDHAD
jgi:hypothetical protein